MFFVMKDRKIVGAFNNEDDAISFRLNSALALYSAYKKGDFSHCPNGLNGLTIHDFSKAEQERFDFATLEEQYFLDIFNIQYFDVDGFLTDWQA